MSTTGDIKQLVAGAGALDTTAGGVLRVAPSSPEGCALVLAEASRRGWRVRLAGSGTWAPGDAPADLVLTTTGLTAVRDVAAADLVATIEAGVRWDALRATLAESGAWLPLDPPGANRTVGSVIATATAGPLRSAFGTIRDHLLGLTLVTGDGRVIRSGGRVMKNVAGYDLTRLAAGSFGAFGLVAAVHVRLRRIPRADVTFSAQGARDALLHDALALVQQGAAPAALELLSPAVTGDGTWTLAMRLAGTPAAVDADRRMIAAALSLPATSHTPESAANLWRRVADQGQAPVTFRLGVLPTGLAVACDLVTHHLDEGRMAASVGAGGLRWSGTATADRLRQLRHAAAQHEFPLTLERAPWPVAEAIGHFGAYRDGAQALTQGLSRVFDPAGALVIPGHP